ncbi:potassium uptake protein, TrkH family [Halobacteroides halobius DSM 5150]|uniref:Potassium uptake protein, TrkH family n=1 Tax=Halobacteroides halobius (strain ATCC 35273 / DSM 5150 / MD-1) TaxID=748449 RepID=L0KAD9_HALHC|nr:TrkH family potassium uptake protein [Halobacteroides halobius]AGB41976.1 potassium uptake protein, TrkH family [Halobacteroides halobius DSM 5150]
MKKINELSSAQILSMGYAIIMFGGGLLLTLPIATTDGQGMNFLDALFTATSAAAVTGLIVENTVAYFSFFGELVIMCLIQIGGLGLMIMSTLLALLIGKKVTLKHRLMILDDLDQFQLSGVLQLVKYVVAVTFTIEGLGALILSIRLAQDMPVGKAVYYGIFHSISAFNNAGFDLFGNSLLNFTSDLTVNLTITSLIILGGIGFAVIAEVYSKKKFKRFSLQTKMVLSITLVLIMLSFIIFFILEYSNPQTMGKLSLKGKLLASYFLAVTPRTAGFATVSMGVLRDSSIFLVILLMFIGASPGSTGGGVKTTTLGAIGAVLYSRATGRDDVEIYKRRLNREIVLDALTVVALGLVHVATITIILTITEEAPFLDLLFETVSAFATVGLSTGITAGLSEIGKVLIIITMYLGRIGPVTLAVAIAEKRHKANIRYPEEDIMIG